MKRIVGVLLIFAFLGSAGLVFAAGKKEAEKPVLGLVIWNKYHPVVQIMEAGFLAKAEELGYQGKLYASEGSDLAGAIALGEQAVAEKVAGLAIYQLDPGIRPLMKKASDAGIPVVVPHSMITPSEVPGPIGWVTNDNVAFGIEAGKALAEALGGKGTIAITQGGFNPQENPPAEALTAFIRDNYPDIKVLDPIEEGFDMAVAESRITSLIQANPDISAGFGTTGNSPITWSNACNNIGRDDILIIGMDYSRQNVDLVKNGKVFGIVAQPLFEIFQECAVILDAYIKGKPYQYENLLPSPVVLKKDINTYDAILNQVEEAFASIKK